MSEKGVESPDLPVEGAEIPVNIIIRVGRRATPSFLLVIGLGDGDDIAVVIGIIVTIIVVVVAVLASRGARQRREGRKGGDGWKGGEGGKRREGGGSAQTPGDVTGASVITSALAGVVGGSPAAAAAAVDVDVGALDDGEEEAALSLGLRGALEAPPAPAQEARQEEPLDLPVDDAWFGLGLASEGPRLAGGLTVRELDRTTADRQDVVEEQQSAHQPLQLRAKDYEDVFLPNGTILSY